MIGLVTWNVVVLLIALKSMNENATSSPKAAPVDPRALGKRASCLGRHCICLQSFLASAVILHHHQAHVPRARVEHSRAVTIQRWGSIAADSYRLLGSSAQSGAHEELSVGCVRVWWVAQRLLLLTELPNGALSKSSTARKPSTMTERGYGNIVVLPSLSEGGKYDLLGLAVVIASRVSGGQWRRWASRNGKHQDSRASGRCFRGL